MGGLLQLQLFKLVGQFSYTLAELDQTVQHIIRGIAFHKKGGLQGEIPLIINFCQGFEDGLKINAHGSRRSHRRPRRCIQWRASNNCAPERHLPGRERGTGCIQFRCRVRYFSASGQRRWLPYLPRDWKQKMCPYFVISLATWTPLAEAWDREWVMPLPSPMMYKPG